MKKKPAKKKKAKKKVVSYPGRGVIKGDMLPATEAQRTLFKIRVGRELGEGVTRGMAACLIKESIENQAKGLVKPEQKGTVSDIEALNQLEREKSDLQGALKSAQRQMESYRSDIRELQDQINKDYRDQPRHDAHVQVVAERDMLLRLIERQLPRR
jgi:hypothetical protein